MAVNKIISSGFLVFLDQLVFGVTGWIYWLIISKYVSPFEIGQSTAVYSLILLFSALTQLGLQYPMLNRSSAERSQILASVLIIELAVTLAIIPIVVYFFYNVYPVSLQGFSWMGIGILIFLSAGFVGHFVLLGISEAKKVLIIDTIGTIIKFVTGLILVVTGFGTWGILLSFLIQALVIGCITLAMAVKIFEFKLQNMNYLTKIMRDGLVNVPSQLSGLLIFSLSVVLLASFAVPSSDIGIFYIALMISFIVGTFVSSMALMIIPWSSASKVDLSTVTTRIGISLTAPLIAALIASPKLILSVFGTEYLSGATILVLLSIAILPFSIMINAISKFNFKDDPKKLILVGSTQLLTFLITFYLLVPSYGTLGAAFSILIAFVASSIPSIVWSDRILIRYIINTCIAILVGWVVGFGIASVIGGGIFIQIASVLSAVTVTFAIILGLRNTSRNELIQLIKAFLKTG
jgi:O-antigen/teichoic acid export membrane protein